MSLASPHQCMSPSATNFTAHTSQSIQIARHSVVVEVPLNRSNSAVVILASINTADHSEKLRLVVITTLVCSYSVSVWPSHLAVIVNS